MYGLTGAPAAAAPIFSAAPAGPDRIIAGIPTETAVALQPACKLPEGCLHHNSSDVIMIMLIPCKAFLHDINVIIKCSSWLLGFVKVSLHPWGTQSRGPDQACTCALSGSASCRSKLAQLIWGHAALGLLGKRNLQSPVQIPHGCKETWTKPRSHLRRNLQQYSAFPALLMNI